MPENIYITPLLLRLIASGDWKQPTDKQIETIAPFFNGEPLDFLTTVESIKRTSRLTFDTERKVDTMFREYIGSLCLLPKQLPWRDVEQSLLIAVCRNPGDDIAIALDYRTSQTNPRVIGSNWTPHTSRITWQVITPTFTEFLEKLDISYK